MAPQDYTRRSFQAAAALIAVLVCVAFIPPQTICGIPLRRANILSDVLRFDDKGSSGRDVAGARRRVLGRLPPLRGGSSTPAKRPCRPIRSQRSRLPPTRCPPHRSSLSNGRPPTANRRRSLHGRYRTVIDDAHPDRRFRYARRRPPVPLLRATGRHRPPHTRAHRRTGRLVHRGRHPHGRPARTAATALRRPRLRFRADVLAPDRLPPHGRHPFGGMELLQHHAAPHYARGAARRLLRFGLALPPRRRCDGALDGQRLPPPPRPLRRGAAALHQPRAEPAGTHAQRFAAPHLRHTGVGSPPSDRRTGAGRIARPPASYGAELDSPVTAYSSRTRRA